MDGAMGNSGKDTRIRDQVDALGSRLPRAMVQDELTRLEHGRAYKRLMWAILIGLVVSAAAIVIITNLWLAVFKVNGSSMNPLLQMDEIVLATRTDDPFRNDVIAFYHNNKLHIKRVIAIGGDKVDIDAVGNVSLNGEKLREPYITQPSRGDCDIEMPFTVPSGSFFVLGDHREASVDSRESDFGAVNRDQVIGRVTFILWPLSRMDTIESD